MRRNTIEPVKLRLLATVMLAGLVSACSSDVARFSDNPFQNPFNTRTNFDPPTTSSINRGTTQQAQRLQPVVNGAATTQPLPAPNQPMIRQQASLAPVAAAPLPRSTSPTAVGSVASAAYPQLGPTAPRATTALGPSQGWTAVGGTPVTLQQGESLNTLSGRYGVPVSALLAVNGLSSVNAARPGQQIMIPTYNAVQGSSTSAPRVAAAQTPPSRETITDVPRTAPVAPRATVRDVSQRAETDAEKRAAAKLKQLRQRDDDEDETPAVPSRATQKVTTVDKAAQTKAAQEKAAQEKARAEKLQIEAQRKREAEMKAAEARKIEEQKKLAEAQRKREAQKVAAAKVEPPETTASIPEQKVTRNAAPAPAAPQPAAEEADSSSSFRWPAQGRVINGFGGRSASGANDGINIAVPEGTPVRAAEAGTVIHADDALKGYGKLVLVRHANGYVTVYAHNSDIKVKRGENVRRGQVIAASGSSGNVTSPQLHFQVRKGSQALDPMKVLSSN